MDVPEPTPQQVREWAACGIAAAAARFIPVPLLDEVVKSGATRLAVSRTLAAHGRGFGLDAVEPLVDPEGRGNGLLQRLKGVPRKIVLFPVRKYVALFGAVRGVPADVLQVVLLGRAVHRALEQGRLADGTDAAALRADAVAVRRAFDEAFENTDLRLVAGALRDGLSEGRELTDAAVEFARRTFARRGADDAGAAADVAAPGDPRVREGAERVERTLRRPEVAARLDRFDARFDERLAVARA